MAQNLTEEAVRQALAQVKDPDIGTTLKELDALKNIRFHDNKIEIDVEMVQPVHWAAETINTKCAEALEKKFPGIESEINFLEKPQEDYKNREILPNVKNIIAVASGKGGVGKSAVSSNIAAALSLTGAKVGILDGDVYGPSQPTMFGLSDNTLEAYETDDGKTAAYPLEQYGIKVASMGFILNREQAAIVRGPMLAGYFSLLFEQVQWGPLDFLVFDLPPGTGDIQLTLTQKIPLTGAVIVTTPQEISVVDVRRSIAMFRKVNVPILGIIENMSYFIPDDMPDKKYYIFGEGGGRKVAEESKANFLGEVPLSMKMRENNDSGKPIVLADTEGKQAGILKNITSEIVSRIRKHNFENKGNVEIEV